MIAENLQKFKILDELDEKDIALNFIKAGYEELLLMYDKYFIFLSKEDFEEMVK